LQLGSLDRLKRRANARANAQWARPQTSFLGSEQVELLGVVFVSEGLEVGAAAGFVEACCANDY